MRSASWTFLVAAGALVSISPMAHAAYPDCLTGTPSAADLTAWRDAAAQATNQFGSTDVANNIRRCFPQTVPTCLQRTAQIASRSETGSLNEPYESTPQRHPPAEFMAPNAQGFQYWMRPDLEEVAKSKGWLTAKYKSRHSGGFDSDTSSLLMVYIPGDKVDPPVDYDRWMNFALPRDNGADALKPLPQSRVPTVEDYAAEANGTGQMSIPRTLTMLSLRRATDTQPARVWFQMFSRGSGANYMPASNGPCGFACHPNGLRAISPLGFHVRPGEEQLPKEVWESVQAMNLAMDDGTGGRLVSWGDGAPGPDGRSLPAVRREAEWPIIGPTRPVNRVSRTQEFILGGRLPDGTQTPGCYKSRQTITLGDIFGRPPGRQNSYTLSSEPVKDWRKVRNAMNCERCHNNRQRYAISVNTDPATVDYKILVDQSMPPGTHLDPIDRGDPSMEPFDSLTLDERISVANCLQAEAALERPLFNQWLKQEACQ